jgi:hypothetical protein
MWGEGSLAMPPRAPKAQRQIASDARVTTRWGGGGGGGNRSVVFGVVVGPQHP